MLARAVSELVDAGPDALHEALHVLGTPVLALLIGTLAAMVVLGRGVGGGRKGVAATVEAALPPVATTLLVIAAGGGFKQTLVASGVADLIAGAATGAHLNPLLLGWLVAVGIRLATGSATVATITASGIVAPLAGDLSQTHLALVVLAVGAGSVIFSFVNDAGFWLVKEYFGMTIVQTIKTWSALETIIAVVGLAITSLLWVLV